MPFIVIVICICENYVQQQQSQQPIYYPLGNVQTYQQQPQPAAQLNGVVQHDEILQNLTPSNNNIAVNNVNNTSAGKYCDRFYSARFLAQ